jgi:hypothetical protein
MEEQNMLPATQEQTIIDKSIDVFKGGSGIILNHRDRVSKALVVGNNILEQWKTAYMIADPLEREKALQAVDERSQKFLVNSGAALGQMQENRKAITQLMDAIKKMFTSEENKLDPKLDTIPAKVQVFRNQRAKEVVEEQERKRQEAELRAARATEISELRAAIKNCIANKLIEFLANKKLGIVKTFDTITLDTYQAKAEGLTIMRCSFPAEKLSDIIGATTHGLRLRYVKPDDEEKITDEERSGYDYSAFAAQYETHLMEQRQALIDRLPSKLAELQEQKRLADEAEARRQEELKRQQEAEARRQQELQQAKSAAAKKRMEEEAAAARKADADRLVAMEREAAERKAAAEREQQQREERERQRIEEQAAAHRKEAEQKAELERASGTAQSLFEAAAEIGMETAAPETRGGYSITVLHPAGIVELFTFWFNREATKLSVEEMMGKSLQQIKAYAEKAATKGDRIESKHLRYETTTKAVNRKAKTA